MEGRGFFFSLFFLLGFWRIRRKGMRDERSKEGMGRKIDER